MPELHNVLVAKVAKDLLQPLGFRRKGRSRVWLLDRDWWVVVVEFQPSGWTKASSLNVGAHWLWSASGYISFDVLNHAPGFVEFESSEQFALGVRGLAESAAVEARRLLSLFSSIEGTAAELIAEELDRPDRARGGWHQYNAGIAAGLAGQCTAAASLLASITDDRVKPHADQMAPLAADPAGFRQATARLVARQREALGLDTIPAIRF